MIGDKLSLAEFPFGRQTGRQAKQCTFKRSFYKAIFRKTTFRRTLVCLSACLLAKWEFRQTQLALPESLAGLGSISNLAANDTLHSKKFSAFAVCEYKSLVD